MFKHFSIAVNTRFNFLTKNPEEVFQAEISGDELWDAYLAAFPAGSNPIYITNPEHHCSTCRNFVKNIGGLIAIKADGSRHSVWGDLGVGLPVHYQVVAATLNQLVLSKPIRTIFRTTEPQYGAETTNQRMVDLSIRKWHHLWAVVPAALYAPSSAAAQIGTFNTSLQVFRRTLNEISVDLVDQVLELITANTLYRGEEHKGALTRYRTVKQKWDQLEGLARENFELCQVAANKAPLIRSTVIGSLLVDLAEGRDLESAVLSFEQKVAPTNYRRPTAVVTPRMVQDAAKTIQDLGLEASLSRRHAVLADVSINNVLWVSGKARGQMKNQLESLLAQVTDKSRVKAVQEGKARSETIQIEDFLTRVLPTAKEVSLMVENHHLSAFVTLTTAVDETSPTLFKWNNHFAWSYAGNLTDSIRERVKAAGGNVQADVRVSLSWSNYDDLDLHCSTPHNNHIYFGNKLGILDVDMNAGSGKTRQPVENLAFVRPADGTYKIWVNQFCKRETTNVGFTIEIADKTKTLQWTYDSAVQYGSNVQVGIISVKNGVIEHLKIDPALKQGAQSTTKWGIETNKFVPVSTIMKSPNHWVDETGIGNRHWFFFLEGCSADEPARGIYNEFLKGGLDKHRKVFELLGSRTLCEPVTGQLSGLGFSSTQVNVVTLLVTTGDGSARSYTVQF